MISGIKNYVPIDICKSHTLQYINHVLPKFLTTSFLKSHFSPYKSLFVFDFLQTPHIHAGKYIDHQVLHVFIIFVHYG